MKNTEIIDAIIEKDGQRQDAGEMLSAQNANIMMSHSIVSADVKGQKGTITMGVDAGIVTQIATGGRKLVAILYLIDHDEYHKLAGNIPT